MIKLYYSSEKYSFRFWRHHNNIRLLCEEKDSINIPVDYEIFDNSILLIVIDLLENYIENEIPEPQSLILERGSFGLDRFSQLEWRFFAPIPTIKLLFSREEARRLLFLFKTALEE